MAIIRVYFGQACNGSVTFKKGYSLCASISLLAYEANSLVLRIIPQQAWTQKGNCIIHPADSYHWRTLLTSTPDYTEIGCSVKMFNSDNI
jgi:hypothetical protein